MPTTHLAPTRVAGRHGRGDHAAAHGHRRFRRHRPARAARHARAGGIGRGSSRRTSASSSAPASSPTRCAGFSRTAAGAAGWCASRPPAAPNLPPRRNSRLLRHQARHAGRSAFEPGVWGNGLDGDDDRGDAAPRRPAPPPARGPMSRRSPSSCAATWSGCASRDCRRRCIG